ncbi:hypothetical protein LTR36_004020 [Oleoguttula mirabilis]|uniref:Spermine/spermidine synthase n=1 Tax=Oleoguttula mirabilis TaxID=1507867 RepID=A0AAV9JIN7_9PEZI|nr:hypothetical protein LTR36_004020 [Oleoguttula mirabilis]
MVKGRQTVRLPQGKRKHDEPSDAASQTSLAQDANSTHAFSPKTLRKTLGVALPLLALAALTSPVSQATLAPVYGSLPSRVNHAEAITATMLLGYLWRAFLRDAHAWSILPYLALWALWMPLMQVYVFQYSARLGPVIGPIITGFLSCHTIVIPSAYAAAQALEAFDLQGKLGNIGGVALPALALDLLYFRPLEYVMAHHALPRASAYFTSGGLGTPVKLQLALGAAYTLLSPDKPYWLFSLAAPAVFHALLANPHFDSQRAVDVVNRDLAVHNWTLLDRAWSNTGYISVLESTDLQYRVLRCDHSLLGGEWLLTPERQQKEGWKVNEPVYAVFEMLEAVRLVEVEPAVADNEAQALVIGLGIGTAPKALMAHGIKTTIVELDPVVHKYAQQYFGLPWTTTILQDAVTWVGGEASALNTSSGDHHNGQKYDYILHDVFTSGAEPLALFTDAFLANLRALLTPNGVIALNYAGDLSSPLTARALNTISQTFAGQCKLFRDAPPPPPPERSAQAATNTTGSKAAAEEAAEDFLNLVVFCRNTPGPISFRKPTSKDFLGSKSRAHYLLPRADYEMAFPSVGDNTTTEAEQRDAILRKGEEGQWRKQQEESAIRHWHIMRKVLPAAVWELW